jgi:SNF2 family DNA or RNA helicase
MQAIIAARLLYRSSHITQVLVVCPKSLFPNWKAEFRKWWPNVQFHISTAGQDVDRRRFLKLATNNAVVKIINYEKLAKEVEWLKRLDFTHDLVIIDEAQNIKNSSSAKAQAVKLLKASRRWALTGTPLENHLTDVISIFGFVSPGVLSADDSIQRVRSRISPFFLRRRTDEVIHDLPELIEQTVEIELSDNQRDAYERMERDAIVELNAKGDSITVHHIFAQILKLKQLCNFDPKTGQSAKIERLLEDLEEIAAAERKALVFSQFVEPPFGLKTVAAHLEQGGHRVLQFHGSIPDARRNSIKEEFCSSNAPRALLLNYKTGGVGLNLQVANYVFLFDRWWNDTAPRFL